MGNRLNQALSTTDIRSRGVSLSTERPCMGSVHHSPRPLTTSPVVIKDGMTVDLCGTCAANLAAYIVLDDSYPDGLPWILAREYGNTIRRYGEIQAAGRKDKTE